MMEGRGKGRGEESREKKGGGKKGYLLFWHRKV